MMKLYDYTKSPFYRIGRKRDLAKKLCVSPKQLKKLESDASFWTKELDSGRSIQVPFGLNRVVHDRIKDLFVRIYLPGFVKAGKKSLSIVDNAKPHKKNRYLRKMDITKFYPSCSQYNLFRTLKDHFDMTPDVAYSLSRICTFNGYVPTGSPLSNIIAYYTNQKLFLDIESLCKKHSIKFTLYVDDITLSSKQPIDESIIRDIKAILKRNHLKTKKKKQKAYSAKENKLVTGVAINKNGDLVPPNKTRHKIYNLIKKNKDLSKLDESELYSLRGLLSSCRLIQPDFMKHLYSRVNKALSAQKI